MIDYTGRPRVLLRLACCGLLVGAITSACQAPTEGGFSSEPIRVIKGGEQTDTAGAMLSQPLVVEIRDANARIARGRTVQFKQILPPGPPPAGLIVAPIGGDPYAYRVVVSAVTDAQGRATTFVRFLSRAGTALLEVSVPELGLVDTVTYTIKAGAPTRFEAWPRDTTIAAGATFAVKSSLTDQFYNLVPGATPTYSATGVTVSSSGQVSGTATISRAKVRVTYGQYADSVSVSVVPLIRMVYNRAGSVVLINSDGSGSTTLATSSDLWLAPSSVAATSSVVFHRGDPSTNGKIWVVQPGGTPRLLLGGVTRPESWPRLSPDGVWVYFVRDITTLWRAKLDGSALDSLTSFTPVQLYRAPTISPDGNSVAVEDGNGLKIVDVPTKTTRTLSVTCPNPRYSPDGAFFACAGSQAVSIVRTDGTGRRVVAQFSDGRTADSMTGLDWTPDGKWIFALVYGPTLIEVSSGALIAMTAVNGNVFQPSFVR